MTRVIIKTEKTERFFERGRKLGQLADRKRRMGPRTIISFEEPADLLKLLTAARLSLFRAVKEKPDSITGIAERLHRDRSAVKRDVDELARIGLIEIESKPLPGHGQMKHVRVAACQFKLEAELT